MITSRQIRAARMLLGWTQKTLADKALVALTTLKKIEAEPDVVRSSTLGAVRDALEKNGIEFLSSTRGEGVLLVRSLQQRASRR